jgi:transcriptional regulator with XRE-family HTH domain
MGIRIVKATILAVNQSLPNIYERITELRKQRGINESDRGFCRRIGISESYLSQLKVEVKRNPGRSLDVGTAALIAAELGVTVEELLYGSADSHDAADPYPSRADAISAARTLQLPPEAIAAAYELTPKVDPGRRWWFDMIEAAEARLSVEQSEPIEVNRPGRAKRIPKMRIAT